MIKTPVMPERPSIIQRHRWKIPEELQSYFVFTSVRHPLDRMVSAWAYGVAKIDRDIWQLHGKRLSFEESANLRTFPLPLQKPYIENSDFLVRYESLEEDFNKLPFIEDKVSMPHENSTDRKNWEEYFTHNPRLLRKCTDKWREDFDLLHYKMWRIAFM